MENTSSSGVWVSDAVAEMLRALGLPYVCLTPGASYRGLHDSLVNHLGNHDPEMIPCLHEEHAVAMAHGWAKVTGKPLGVVLHANVGLMHATMAIFNAWCDRVPMLILGATGTVDAARRRPWIEWIHTARDQGALVRDYTKWDDQPASVDAMQEALLRAVQIATTAPRGPVYICLDVGLQETRLPALPPLPDMTRFQAPAPVQPPQELVERAADWLVSASRPVILMGRVSRDPEAWQKRTTLAECLGATVLTDLKAGAAFPTDHPLHGAPPNTHFSPDAAAVLKSADVVLALDWIDLAGTLKRAWGAENITAKVIRVSPDQLVHNGWSMDYQALAPADLYLLSEPDTLVAPLLAAVPERNPHAQPRQEKSTSAPVQVRDHISLPYLAQTLQQTLGDQRVCLIRLPLGWSGGWWHFHRPLDYLGNDGGGGVGSGPGMTVGAALALRGTGELPVAILGDGDYLMGLNALWTAAHARIPLLIVVANNGAYMNDVHHQERIALERERPVENRWVGQRIDDPAPDLALLARGQGLEGFGPVTKPEELAASLTAAIAQVIQGKAAVVDVRVAPEG